MRETKEEGCTDKAEERLKESAKEELFDNARHQRESTEAERARPLE